MMNGKDINDAISRKDKGTVALAMAKKSTPAAVIRSLYLASLNREPTQHEMTKIMNSMKLLKTVDKDPAAPYQDLFWALLNSNEFLLNH
jgi:hypothetical protein